MSHDKTIKVYNNDKLICIIDTMNPDLSDFINSILNFELEELNSIKCETEIEDFDIKSFTEIIKQSIKDLKDNLKSEMDNYEKIIESVVFDKNVEDYVNDLLLNK